MATNHELGRRLNHLDDQMLAARARAESERIGALVGCPPELLLQRAQEIAEQIELLGVMRVIELVADGVGCSPEQLEARAARLASGGISA